MPRPGDQHCPPNRIAGDQQGPPNRISGNQQCPYTNPFHASPDPIHAWTAQEIATLQARLDKQLGPEYVSSRAGAGGAKVQYLEAWKCINIANDVFGFNGWSSSIQNVHVDFMDEAAGRFSLGLSVVVRVTLKDGTYHEASSSSQSLLISGCRAKKEGTTDALKRALRTFGNVLGNCLYDKAFCKEISKVKPANPRFDAHDLYQRPEYPCIPALPTSLLLPDMSSNEDVDQHKSVTESIPVQPSIQVERKPSISAQSADTTFEQFGDDDFDNMDFFEDKPVLPESPRLGEFETDNRPTPEPQLPPTYSHEHRTPIQQCHMQPRPVRPPNKAQQKPPIQQIQMRIPLKPPNGSVAVTTADSGSSFYRVYNNHSGSANHSQNGSTSSASATAHNKTLAQKSTPSPDSLPEHDPTMAQVSNLPPGTFFSARAALTDTAQPISAFNPTFDSPSMRRTSGVDPKKSTPIVRKSGIGMPPPPPGGAPATPGLPRYRNTLVNNGKRNSAGLLVDNRGPLGEISAQAINQPEMNDAKKLRT
ncbi:DNA repair and recombination protein radC [Neolecta irregularis DAH-3]|uniref:DNA repair and recombination protein radC n=1 Tax=Neolecta irregularis (strain DAH-3) TaxID=1198029 RepID=A0A1U7LK66_NEOID|nr:DNA repair and recombination protein radC [Neolecta irregularis DAH-3]|eukprot:OLL22942.1 DNA repair and recombination protein radC [Neolecta irregularis DAH-3]